MNSRVFAVSGSLLGLLTAASLCVAAEPSYAPGKASVGGSFGVATFRPDGMLGSAWFGDYSNGAITRFSFAGQFRYAMNSWLRLQAGPGVTWCAYKGDAPIPFEDPRFPEDQSKKDFLTVMVPVSVQAQYVMKHGWWLYHVGFGPGLYRLMVENHRETLKDPVTLDLHRGVYLGVTGELGVEYFLHSLTTTSVEMALVGDVPFAERADQFPSGYNSNAMALSLRVGANYHFSPGVKKKETTQPAQP